MFTRTQYINQECTHRQYYSQFVTKDTKTFLLSFICESELIKAYNSYDGLNSIPLHIWDDIKFPFNISLFTEMGDNYSMSSNVCALKEAAKQIVENKLN